MMNNVFSLEILQAWFNIYIDDLLLGNEGDKADLTQKAIVVLDKLEEHNLFIEPEKSEFFVTKYTGYGIM